MDLEDQLRGDAAGAGSAKLTERLNEARTEDEPLPRAARRWCRAIPTGS